MPQNNQRYRTAAIGSLLATLSQTRINHLGTWASGFGLKGATQVSRYTLPKISPIGIRLREIPPAIAPHDYPGAHRRFLGAS